MKTIPLTKGLEAIVDDEDYQDLIRWKWFANDTGGKYRPARNGPRSEKNRAKIYMYRQIMGFPVDMEVDHINGDPLDNRRGNLRVCGRVQNANNRSKQANNTTGYKGVSLDSRVGRFVVRIKDRSGRYKYIGEYETAKDAAHVYDFAAQLFHGQFAKLNFPLRA
jgi:hypothetical protein